MQEHIDTDSAKCADQVTKSWDVLYQENIGLLHMLARRYRGMCERDRAIDFDDLLQSGFFGLVDASQHWEPERGAWSTVAVWYIRKALRECLGIRTSRIRAEHGALSLDAPLAEDSGTSRMDLLEDETTPDNDEKLRTSEVCNEVNAAMQEIKNQRVKDVIHRLYWQGRTFDALADDMGVSKQRIQQLRDAGFETLRKNRRLQALADIDGLTRFYAHKGLKAFNTDWTSATEAAALWRIEETERINRRFFP